MPQHKSAAKRARQTESRRARNRVHRSKMRTMMKKLRATEDSTEARTLFNDVKSMLDRMSSRGLIHANKAANYKSQLEKHVNAL
ncbi:MAG: 30S ribosomal protein S20 [Bacteroidetes bacterium]|nr:30S ribosomal protein S20 [Bacteroidota bacterium]